MTDRVTGMIIAAPTPAMARAPMSMATDPAKAPTTFDTR